MNEIERRYTAASTFEVEERGDKPAKIRGHAAVFSQLSEDLGGFRERIAPGSFREAIKKDDVRALFNHDSNLVLGRNAAGTLRLSEDAQGLLADIDLPDTSAARDLVVSMKRGDITQMSFGFMVRPNGENWGKDAEGRYVRTLTKVRLFDVSVVTFPACPQTDVAVRSLAAFLRAGGGNSPFWRVALRRRSLALESAGRASHR